MYMASCATFHGAPNWKQCSDCSQVAVMTPLHHFRAFFCRLFVDKLFNSCQFFSLMSLDLIFLNSLVRL